LSRVIWLTGHSGVGKTTIAKELGYLYLDGDEMRESISTEGFSREDRRIHNIRVAKLAKELSKQRTV